MLPTATYSTTSLICSNVFSIDRLGSYAFFIAMSLCSRSVGDFLHNKGKGGYYGQKNLVTKVYILVAQ